MIAIRHGEYITVMNTDRTLKEYKVNCGIGCHNAMMHVWKMAFDILSFTQDQWLDCNKLTFVWDSIAEQ